MLKHRKRCIVLLVILALAQAACASPSGTASTSTTSTTGTSATPTPFAITPAATSTPEATATPQGYQPCGSYMGSQTGATRIGDLYLTSAGAYSDATLYQLPDGTVLKPLAVPQRSSTGAFAGWPASLLGVSAIIAGVCNSSATASHTIQGVRLKLNAFAPYSGSLNQWDYCDGYYTRPQGAQYNNCDRGGPPQDESFQASFAAGAPVGAVANAAQTAAIGPQDGGLGPLPVKLPPGRILFMYVTFTAPTAPGVYTFALSITADNFALPFRAAAPALLAPVAHTWTGHACTAPGMLSQIPASASASTHYICPKS
jgi:hypothetical protein